MTMNKDIFLRNLLDPYGTGIGYDNLKSLTVTYPWFSTAKILYLLSLRQGQDPQLQSEIVRQAPFIHNRRYLHHILHSGMASEIAMDFTGIFNRMSDLAGNADKEDLTPEERKIFSRDENQDALSGSGMTELLEFSYPGSSQITDPVAEGELIDLEFESAPEPPVQEEKTPVPENESGAGRDRPVKGFAEWIGKIENRSPDELNKSDDLIEIFINGGHGPIRADKETSLSGDVSRISIEEDESYITDTLAKIYVKQGLYSKAIYAYEKLSLKYPEKSIYFATQIEEIKQLINKK